MSASSDTLSGYARDVSVNAEMSRAYGGRMTVLLDPTHVVPEPEEAGPFGSMAWLRATVCRFVNGETHERRRAIIEAMLAKIDPEDLHARAREPIAGVPRAYRPVAVLAEATGVNTEDPAAFVADVRAVAAAYRPGTDAPGAEEALARLVARLPRGNEEHVAQRVALLVQGCEPMAAMIEGATTPVPATKRIAPDGTTVEVPLHEHPFGAGPRRCPGERHARALVEAVR
jgi:hypothetical protein